MRLVWLDRTAQRPHKSAVWEDAAWPSPDVVTAEECYSLVVSETSTLAWFPNRDDINTMFRVSSRRHHEVPYHTGSLRGDPVMFLVGLFHVIHPSV